MSGLQSALELVVGWLEEGENLDRFAAYLQARNSSNQAEAALEANEVFELLRDASDWPSAIDNTADWDAD